jgi:signal transduction histidine kinase
MPQREAPLPLRILLVEDSEHDALTFRRAFRKALAPCDIALCERAEEALTQLCAQTASFDLVVADYKLPSMSGLELYRALRASNIPIPLVLLTGAGTEYLAVEALKAGVDDYIIKDAGQGYVDLLPLVLSEVVQRYRDRLDHQRAQETLRKLETELRQAQKIQAIGTLAGGIAHEFNNILMAILGYTSLILDDVPQDSTVWSNAQRVFQAGERAKHLVQQILAFSRQTEPEHTPVKLHILVQEALGLIQRTLPTTLTLRQDVDQDVGTVLISIPEVHQLLMNLCANAAHAMREAGGMLDIRLDTVDMEADLTLLPAVPQPGSYARLSVRDTGHGMTPDVVERIFEPFFTTKGVGEGTGMGLAVVHGIVTHSGGAITVESTPGEGTTFVIYMPRVAEVATTIAALEAPPPGAQSLHTG